MSMLIDISQIVNKGMKKAKFADGTEIIFNYAEEHFTGTFLGTIKNETLGRIEYNDAKNNLSGHVHIGKVKKKLIGINQTIGLPRRNNKSRR